MIETELFNLLSPLVEGRVFPHTAPLTTPVPYIIFTRYGGTPIRPIGKEVPTEQNGVFQIEVWHNSMYAAIQIAQAVDATLRTAEVFIANVEDELAYESEPDLGLFGTRQDFSIWGERS